MLTIYEEKDQVYYVVYDVTTNKVSVEQGVVSQVHIPGDYDLLDVSYILNGYTNRARYLHMSRVFHSYHDAMESIGKQIELLCLKIRVMSGKEKDSDEGKQTVAKYKVYHKFYIDYITYKKRY